MSLGAILLSTILVNNFVLVKFLGICSFLGVSKKIPTALGMGAAVTFVMTLSVLVTWAVQTYVLDPFGLTMLQSLSFILIIASLVQFVEMFLKRFSPTLHGALGVYLPLITTNCAVLGVALMAVSEEYNLLQTLFLGAGAGMGFTLGITLFAAIREQLERAPVPEAFRGLPLTLIAAGLVSLAFMGFAGMI